MKYKRYYNYAEFDKEYGFAEKAGFQLTKLQIQDVETFVTWDANLNTYEVGGGKTVVSSAVALMRACDQKVVTVPPVLITPWAKWLNKVSDGVLIYRGTPKQRKDMDITKPQWLVMSHAIFRDDQDRLSKELADELELIVDECFAAGTKILTPSGEAPIETLQPGSDVVTSMGVAKVSKIFYTVASETLTLRFKNGATFRCTGTHPIFSDIGWIPARACKGRRVLRAPPLRLLQEPLHKELDDTEMVYEKRKGDRLDLFSLLWDESQSRSTSRGLRTSWVEAIREATAGGLCSRSAEKAFDGRAQAQVERNAEGDGTRTFRERWQRYWADRGRKSNNGEHGIFRVLLELCCSIRGSSRRLSDKLQVRFRAPWPDGGGGSRRILSQSLSKKGSGRKEDSEAQGAWVECVSVDQSGNTESVWNLEVSGCPHYFAEGMLVHNCHALKNPASVLFRKVQRTCLGL